MPWSTVAAFAAFLQVLVQPGAPWIQVTLYRQYVVL